MMAGINNRYNWWHMSEYSHYTYNVIHTHRIQYNMLYMYIQVIVTGMYIWQVVCVYVCMYVYVTDKQCHSTTFMTHI